MLYSVALHSSGYTDIRKLVGAYVWCRTMINALWNPLACSHFVLAVPCQIALLLMC